MTVSQHNRMMIGLAARCSQKGAFKACMECGYQDGHDEICQHHESKRTPSPDAELVALLRIAAGSIREICHERDVPLPNSTLRRIDAKLARLNPRT